MLCDDNAPITFYNFSSTSDPITNVEWIFENGSPATVNAIEAQTTFPGEGSYDVTMIVDNGICQDTITKEDYINIGPAPVANFTLDVNSGCEPLEVNFTDLSTVSSGNITSWNWDFGDGTTDTNQNPTHIFAADNNILITLEVTTDEGCTHIFTQTIDVYGPNELTISDDVAICIGEVAYLDVQVMGDTTGSTFSWSPATGLSCTDCFSPEANPSDTTTYTFTMTNAFGCTSSAEVTVQAKPSALPVIQLTPDTTICWNTDLQLTADPGAGNYTYEWDATGLGLSCYDCANPIATPTQNTNYTVTVTNDFDCSSTATMTVNVIDERTPFLGADRIICEDGSIELDASFGNNPQWMITTDLSCANCPNPIASPSSPTMYLAQVTTDNGCIIEDDIFIDILSPDGVDAGPDKTVCAGESILLSGYGDGSVTWSPAGDLNDPNIINPMATPVVSTTYFMTLTNGDCVITDSLTVEVTNSTQFDLEDITICEGESIELEVSGNVDQFEWSASPTLSQLDIENPIANPTDTTSYTLIAALGSCLPDTQVLTVNVIPAPVTNLPEVSNFFPGQSIEVELTVNGESTYGYQWSSPENVSCVTCSVTEISPESEGTYEVLVMDFETGCSSVDSIQFKELNSCPPSLIGVPNAFSPNGDGNNDVLIVYPSPNMVAEGIISFRVFDRWGAQMFESNDPNEGWDGKYKGKLMDIGVYLYYIEYPCPVDGSVQIKRGTVTLVR